MGKFLDIFKDRFSLTIDKADDSVIDERIRGDVQMQGSNLWVLMFAIFIASIGLNVNSTAVIIGAMLISPLMGPIMGIGYGAGINDFALVRIGAKNLFIATLIALFTSTIYFLLSPLSLAQSELLARTTPTIWDVLVALFGGLAGIVAITRKEKTNVIPGVAIATALMPPLCTAGFGLATQNMRYFFGAFYLYIINVVFIALSSFLIVKAFNITKKVYVDATVALKAQRYIAITAFVTMLPSLYLAYQLVSAEIFKAKIKQFVSQEMNFEKSYISQIKIDPDSASVELFLIGEPLSEERIKEIKRKLLAQADISNANLKIYQNRESAAIDVASLKSDILADLYRKSQEDIEKKDMEILKLKEEIASLQRTNELFVSMQDEMSTLFPYITDVVLSSTHDPLSGSKMVILNGKLNKKISKKEEKMIKDWVQKRVKDMKTKVYLAGK